MDCLRDYIGIMGCDAPVPDSGKYINSLPGISLKSMDAIANSEQITFLGAYNDIQDRAIASLRLEIKSNLRKRYALKSVPLSIDLGRVLESDVIAASASYKGFAIDLTFQDIYRRSNYQVINVTSLSLWSDADVVNAVFKIFELDSGIELFTKTQDIVTGWNLIKVNQSFDSLGIFCAYDGTSIDSKKHLVNQSASGFFGTCVDTIYGSGCCSASLRGASSLIASPDALDLDDDTFGLSGVFSVLCDYDKIICNNREVFTTALWYMLGAETMLEMKNSERLNRFTAMNKKEIDELLGMFQARMESELAIALEGMDIDTGDLCIDCDPPISIRESRM